jgi:hypothetical protein
MVLACLVSCPTSCANDGEGEWPGVQLWFLRNGLSIDDGRLVSIEERPELAELAGEVARLCRRMSHDTAIAKRPRTATPPTTPPAIAPVSVLLCPVPKPLEVELLDEEWPVGWSLGLGVVELDEVEDVEDGRARLAADVAVLIVVGALLAPFCIVVCAGCVAAGGVASNVATPPLVAHSSTLNIAPDAAG